MAGFNLDLSSVVALTDEQFFQLCAANRDLRFERNALGELLIMPPTGGETSRSNAKFTQQLLNWTEASGLGVAFDSSGGFTLPNGADRSPDAAWIKQEHWDALAPDQKERFVPLCPDFVVEIRSPSDSLKPLQAKLQEYLANGTHLGWLINRKSKHVEVYRPQQPVEILEAPTQLSGEAVLPGFVLNLDPIW